jgi:hypothetical protein
MTGVRFPSGERDSLLLDNVLLDTGLTPASYPMGTGGKGAGT